MVFQDFDNVLKLATSILTLPIVGLMVSFFLSRSKNKIKNIEKLITVVSSGNINNILVEALFQSIYRSKYVSAEEVKILMQQENQTRLIQCYSKLNMLIKITELKSVDGDLIIRYSQGLHTLKRRIFWGAGTVLTSILLYVLFLCVEIDFIQHLDGNSYGSQLNNVLGVTLNILVSAMVLIAYNYIFLFGAQILMSKWMINKFNFILFSRR